MDNKEYERLWDQGLMLGISGRYEEALEIYDKLIRLRPSHAQAWGNRGAALDTLGRPIEALECYDKFIQLQPDNANVWYNRGVVLGKLGRHEEALLSYDKAVKIDPSDAMVWYNRSTTLSELGRYEEELNSYDRVIQLQPDFVEAWYNRGVVLYGMGRDKEALEDFSMVIKLQPAHAAGWGNRGSALSELGRYKEALNSYNKALTIDPGNTAAQTGRAMVLELLGDDADQRHMSMDTTQYGPSRPELKTINWGAKCPNCGGHIEPFKKVPRGECKSCGQRVTIKQEPKIIDRGNNCPYCGGEVNPNIASQYHKGPTGKCTVCDRWVRFRTGQKTGQHKQTQQAESCYIVTMCFGIDSPEYMDMIYFRDNTLRRYGIGRAIISAYYSIGGQLVKYLGYSSTARAVSTHIVKGILIIVRRWNRYHNRSNT